MSRSPELSELAALSARIGRNPLLAQASSGNTSIKIGGQLWVKASGKWLASAVEDEETFVSSADPRASVETPTHAALPQRVVIHVHSINTISWAVRVDGEKLLASRLRGLPWCWVPYVPSGEPLAKSIAAAIAKQPELRVFVLANHGLVVCADDCASAEALLMEVERCVAAPVRGEKSCEDPVSRKMLAGGVLFPCQAIFLDTGALNLTVAQRAVFDGLCEVVRRLDENALIRYLSTEEIDQLKRADVHGYADRTGQNCR